MQRRPDGCRIGVVAGAAVVGAAITRASHGAQQASRSRGNVSGEWRVWGADAWSTRYSPLDQINAANFDSLKVAWQWNAGAFGKRRVLSHHAAVRERPAVHRGDHAPRGDGDRSGDRRDALDVAPRRRHSLAEGAAPVRRSRSDVLDRRQRGARDRRDAGLPPGVARREDRRPDPRFGKNGVVDLMDGLGYPLVPLAVDDSGSLIISDAAPARGRGRARRGIPVKKIGADGTIGIDPALRADRRQLAGRSSSTT